MLKLVTTYTALLVISRSLFFALRSESLASCRSCFSCSASLALKNRQEQVHPNSIIWAFFTGQKNALNCLKSLNFLWTFVLTGPAECSISHAPQSFTDLPLCVGTTGFQRLSGLYHFHDECCSLKSVLRLKDSIWKAVWGQCDLKTTVK